MPNPQRVLIVGDASLFTTGLTAWLVCDTNWPVTSVCFDDAVALSHEVDRGRPSTIIVSAATLVDVTPLLNQMALLYEGSVVRVIIVDPDSNKFEVYAKQHKEVTRSADFIESLRGETSFASA